MQLHFKTTKTLRQRVLHAGAWTLISHVGSQVLRFGSNLIMTRLLVPEMFGIMVLANVTLMGLQLLSDLGLRQNIVQSHRGNDQTFLNTIWTIQILRGCLIFAVALGMAFALYGLRLAHWLPEPSAYAEPGLPWIIAVLSLNAIINGFESTKYGTAARNMDLKKKARIDLVSQASGIVFMLVWAILDRSIWALVSGSLVSSLLRVILGNALLPGEKNKLHWDTNIFREVLRFGKWIFASSILSFLTSNGDRLILGGLVDARTLGMYSIAFFMVSALKDVFSKLIGNVAFPALSEVARDHPSLLKQTYYKFRHPLDVATLLATGVCFFSGHLIIKVFYDQRYASAGSMLEILCIILFEVRYWIIGQCYMALGRPKLLIPSIGIQALALYGLMPVAFSWYGLNGALWVAGGNVLFSIPVNFYFTYKLGLFDIKQELRALQWLVYGLVLGWSLNEASIMIGWPK